MLENNPTLEKIKAYINDQDVKCIVKDILKSSSLAINAKDGSVTANVYPHNLGMENNLQLRMAVSALSAQSSCFENIYEEKTKGVRLVFDGRKEEPNMLDQNTNFHSEPYATVNTQTGFYSTLYIATDTGGCKSSKIIAREWL